MKWPLAATQVVRACIRLQPRQFASKAYHLSNHVPLSKRWQPSLVFLLDILTRAEQTVSPLHLTRGSLLHSLPLHEPSWNTDFAVLPGPNHWLHLHLLGRVMLTELEPAPPRAPRRKGEAPAGRWCWAAGSAFSQEVIPSTRKWCLSMQAVMVWGGSHRRRRLPQCGDFWEKSTGSLDKSNLGEEEQRKVK